MIKMDNYGKRALKISFMAIAAIIVAKMLAWWIDPKNDADPQIFAGVTVFLLLYSLTDFFITAKPAEADGTYRRIPILTTTAALSLSGMITSIPLGQEYWLILGFNFVLFVASLVFITHILVASINHAPAGKHPLRDPEEVQKLFYYTFTHGIIVATIFLATIYNL